MFKKNPDSMRMEPTPERVYAVCRLAARQSLAREELIGALSLGEKGSGNHGEIRASIALAMEDLGLLAPKDERLVFQGDKSIVETPAAFRRYVSGRVFAQKDSTFALFSRWFLAKNQEIFLLDRWEDKANRAKQEVAELSALTENDMLGWRFWASFLGLGYLSGTALIPNLKTRLQDAMAGAFPFPYGEPVAAGEFAAWLAGALPEGMPAAGGALTMGLSAGLRTLHDLSLITLEARRDVIRIPLHPVDGDPFNEFSHVTVKEEVAR